MLRARITHPRPHEEIATVTTTPQNGNITPLWDNFVERARRYLSSVDLDEVEIDYKLEIGQKLAEARRAVLAERADWRELTRKGFSCNLIFNIQQSRLRTWIHHLPHEALPAFQRLWREGDISVEERIRDFNALLPEANIEAIPPIRVEGTGTRANVISVLLMAMGAENHPPFRTRAFNNAYTLTGYERPGRNDDIASRYTHALRFLDRFIAEADERGVHLRNYLDAQSIVWALYSNQDQPDDDGEETDPSAMDESTVSTQEETIDLPALARTLYLLDDSFLKEISALLEDKRQVIFQGPPGTGKTYVARELAKHLAGSTGSVEVVQFHPSYAYEDFVQGYRPELTAAGQPSFALKNGPLLRAADRARSEPGASHYLIIDEINRGNLAKVFGELYFLLEYREQEMRLQYSDQPFSLPRNLYIIGTMNTADRSIALVDLALRRRFAFVEFDVGKEPVNGLLRRYLSANAPAAGWVAKVVELANQRLDDRRAAIGPSYFMSGGLTPERIVRIWNHSVIPYVEEHLFDDPARLADFDLEELRNLVDIRTETENTAVDIVKSWLGELGADSSTAVLGDPEDNYSNRSIKWIRFIAASGSTHPTCAVRVDDKDRETVDVFTYEMRQEHYIATHVMRGRLTEMANHKDRIMNYARLAIEEGW